MVHRPPRGPSKCNKVRRWLALFMAGGLAWSAAAQTDTIGLSASAVVAIQSVAPVFAPVHRMDSLGLRRAGAVDLEGGLNQIPGVKMETRGAGGSRRIRMRGSSLRSPFGVRNVWTLLDGFVLTTADGDSPLEWLDPGLLAGVEVMTGPSGAALGGSYSGALWAQSAPRATRLTMRGATLGAGAAGEGASGSVVAQAAQGPWQVGWVSAAQPGFREQEANRKHQGDLHWRQSRGEWEQHAWLGLFDGMWELPGSLNAEDADAVPTRAPGVDYGARVERRRVATGWSQERDQGGFWALLSLTDKHNPYGTSPFYNGDKREQAANASLRMVRRGILHEGDRSRWTWLTHAVVQSDGLRLEETDIGGAEMRYDLGSRTHRGWASAGMQCVGASGVTWHAGLAANHMTRNTEGSVQDSLPFDERFRTTRLLPRAGIRIPAGERMTGFLEWGTGINAPTSFEIVDPATLEATELRPEWGQTLEAGVRTQSGRWQAEATAFIQQVRDAIGVIPGPTDAPVLANADALQMRGIEMQAAGSVGALAVRVWATLHRFAVQTVGDTYAMPGTPLHTAGGTLTWQRRAWSVHMRHRWNDRAPLSNNGADWAPAHHRLDASVTWSQGPWEVSLSALNATDSRYSDWYQVNAFGGKYFNPVAPRRMELVLGWSPTRPR